MSEPRPKPMSWDDYLAWETTQPIKHELIDGEVRAMTGGTGEHGTICNNLRGELRERLRGNPSEIAPRFAQCRPQGPDLKVRTGTGNGRYPDALIDCGTREIGALTAKEPVAVFEVLSQRNREAICAGSTAWIDLNDKFDDYDATPTIRHYILIFQDQVRVMLYERNAQGRFDRVAATVLRGLGDTLPLNDLDISLPLSLIYEGVELDA